MSRNPIMKPPHVVTIDTRALSDALRRARGEYSLREYCEKTGVLNFSTISRIERGAQPDLLTYVLICDSIGAKLDDFVVRWKVSRG